MIRLPANSQSTMKKVKVLFLFWVLLLSSLNVFAEFNFESENTLQGIHRNFPKGASAQTGFVESFLESRTGGGFRSDDFQFEAKFLLRSIQSPSNRSRNDFSFADLTPPRRLLKFYTKLGSDDSLNQTFLDMGNLWGSFNVENWQFTVGRRSIGIGVLRTLPVWNRLYPVVPTLSGYMLANNPDILDVRWSSENWTIAGYSIFSQYYDDAISAIEFIHYGEKLESHFLVSHWWERQVLGYSGVVDTFYGIFRFESLGIKSINQNESNGLQFGLGWEKAVNSKLSFLAEYYQSSYGTSKPKDYIYQDPNPFRTLLARNYLYPKMNYKLTDFISNDFGALVNLVDGSFMLTNETSYSVSDNLDIFGLIKKPMGNGGQEFGHLNISATNQTLEYVEWFSVGLKMTF